jgi:hypothetical protein
LSYRDQPEEIRVEHRSYFRFFAFLDRSEIAVTSVVNQNVDAAEEFFRLSNRRRNLLRLGHI